LKKQSQFVGGQISVKSYMKGDYDKNQPCRAFKNKANQSQFIRSECCVLRMDSCLRGNDKQQVFSL
jgi:hypothetical protein